MVDRLYVLLNVCTSVFAQRHEERRLLIAARRFLHPPTSAPLFRAIARTSSRHKLPFINHLSSSHSDMRSSDLFATLPCNSWNNTFTQKSRSGLDTQNVCQGEATRDPTTSSSTPRNFNRHVSLSNAHRWTGFRCASASGGPTATPVSRSSKGSACRVDGWRSAVLHERIGILSRNLCNQCRASTERYH